MGEEVIRAKIKIRQDELKKISQNGPSILGIVGVLLFFTIIGIIPGIILIIIAIWWSGSLDNEKKKLESEIRDFEAEL